MSTLSFARTVARGDVASPAARLAIALVGIGIAMAFTAAGFVLLSNLFAIPVNVSVTTLAASAGPVATWWWFDAIGAFLCFAAAIATLVETARRVLPRP
jgi:hypothetical protein